MRSSDLTQENFQIYLCRAYFRLTTTWEVLGLASATVYRKMWLFRQRLAMLPPADMSLKNKRRPRYPKQRNEFSSSSMGTTGTNVSSRKKTLRTGLLLPSLPLLYILRGLRQNFSRSSKKKKRKSVSQSASPNSSESWKERRKNPPRIIFKLSDQIDDMTPNSPASNLASEVTYPEVFFHSEKHSLALSLHPSCE